MLVDVLSKNSGPNSHTTYSLYFTNSDQLMILS